MRTPAAVEAAAAGGARFIGLVFYARSPRAVDLATAHGLASLAGSLGLETVGVHVDPDDAVLAATAPILDWLQLHGSESPERVAAVRARFETPVIKAIPVATSGDLAAVTAYAAVADRLLFDTRPPAGSDRPGGHGLAFDWSLLAGLESDVPWMLSGGLDAASLKSAVRASGAYAVDVSSAVETAPGEKNLE
ncbi:MAG: phosphoribosylanthranilate isomerase, partial [Rhodothalassiaceae bacterium]